MGILFLVLSACTNEPTMVSPLEQNDRITDSSCANPVILAISPSDIPANPYHKENAIYHTNLVRGLIVGPDKHMATRVTTPKDCSDKSLRKLIQFDHWTPDPRPENDEPLILYLKNIDVKTLSAEEGLHCTDERTHIRRNTTAKDGIKYHICRYTSEKILSGGVSVTPLLACRFLDFWECQNSVLNERRRIIDLQALNLLVRTEGFDGKAFIQNMEISSKEAELFKLEYSSRIYEKYKGIHVDPDCSNPVEPEACRISVIQKRRERFKTAATALEEILLLSLEAQQAVFMALEQ